MMPLIIAMMSMKQIKKMHILCLVNVLTVLYVNTQHIIQTENISICI